MLAHTAPPLALLHSIFQKIDAIHSLSLAVKEELIKCSFIQELKKGSFLLRQGEHCQNIYFMVSGMVSGQAQFGGKQLTSFITVEGNFVAAIEGLHGETPSSEDIRAEEDSVLLGLPVAVLKTLFARHIDLNILMRKILERYYQLAHRRSVFVRMASATEKYKFLLEAYPLHSDRIPVAVAASFLNLQVATLQRIMREPDRKSKGSSNQISISKEAITTHMEAAKPHLQKKLTLQDLAQQFQTTAHHLSQLLNLHFKENFNHFINRYRINYVVHGLNNDKNLAQYNLEGLGKMAGFSSKTTFFSEFKKHTGHTPASFLKIKG